MRLVGGWAVSLPPSLPELGCRQALCVVAPAWPAGARHKAPRAGSSQAACQAALAPGQAACGSSLSGRPDSSILTVQTLLLLTLSLTFCNHEILMVDIEFKVQFMSGSSAGKGSCKGKPAEWMGGGDLAPSSWRGRQRNVAGPGRGAHSHIKAGLSAASMPKPCVSAWSGASLCPSPGGTCLNAF